MSTSTRAASLLLPLLLPSVLATACSTVEDDARDFDELAAHLAEQLGIEDYEVVVLDDHFVEPDGSPTDEPPSASFPDELASEEDPTMACRLTGWIGHTPICQVCTLDWFWVACIERVDCGDGNPYLRYCSTATPTFDD